MGLFDYFGKVAGVAAFALGVSFLQPSETFAASVAVHDPSIVIVYKDAAGNSYPSNDAAGTREKFYYIFGTQNGGAYSKDMLNWTAFTPTYSRNGTVVKDYKVAFSEAAAWSGHATSADVLGNMWAPDIIYNPKMKKWCLYYSINGDDWMSSVTLSTSDKIEGPYEYKGTVVYGGMDSQSTGLPGNLDYQKVTGSSTIDSRYYMANDGVTNLGKWDGGYGVSAIDPNVFYDEKGILWLLYGSWSGGLFLLKLDENTGLRDYNYKYQTKWDGTAFKSAMRSDEYMGIHVGGGYYVSGEGSYIQYFKDAEGEGYYYLFVSYGFYSPDGGYSMRVFRSKDVKGPYTDVDGNDAVFSRYIYNYGTNTTYGFPIIENYKWSFWEAGHGEIADGHNSLLRDEDGSMYLVYHRKMDNGTAWHNVETHQLFFNEMGWIVAAPFEYRKGYGLPKKELAAADLAGDYKIIIHEPYAQGDGKLPINEEKNLQLNADGSVSGAYTGTWNYDYRGGRHFVTIKTSATTFKGVILDQLQNDTSKRTYTFSAMNSVGDRALWGYKVPKTEVVQSTEYQGKAIVAGAKDFSSAWNDYEKFYKVDALDNFVAEFEFVNNTKVAENWHNWALAFVNGSETWYLRADAYSVSTFANSEVTYSYTWNWDDFKSVFKGAKMKVRAVKDGNAINVSVFAGGKEVYHATATNAPSGSYAIYLGGEASYQEISKVVAGSAKNREIAGTIDDGGVYNAAFNALKTSEYKASGDFNLKFHFMNYANGAGAENWDNFIVRSVSGEKTTLLRADAYALDAVGTFKFEYDWSWDDFAGIMRNADVVMNISRSGSTITYDAVVTAENGKAYHYKAVNTGAPTGEIAFSLTCEKSAVDLLGVSSENIVVTPEDPAEEPSKGGDEEPSKGEEEPSVMQLASSFGFVNAKLAGRSLQVQNASASVAEVSLVSPQGKRIASFRVDSAMSTAFALDGIAQGTYLVVVKTHGTKNLNKVVKIVLR